MSRSSAWAPAASPSSTSTPARRQQAHDVLRRASPRAPTPASPPSQRQGLPREHRDRLHRPHSRRPPQDASTTRSARSPRSPATSPASPTSASATSRPPTATLASSRTRRSRVRYINRWHLEKRDPSLKLSPPKEPIIYYVEHTVPVRYRRWVKEGIALLEQGVREGRHLDAIEVYYQDKTTGAHGQGPGGRALQLHPLALQRHRHRDRAEPRPPDHRPDPRRRHRPDRRLDPPLLVPGQRVPPADRDGGHAAETLAWLDERPQWDPRVRLAAPERRDQMSGPSPSAARGIMAMAAAPSRQRLAALPATNSSA
jgi:hypothetical protein